MQETTQAEYKISGKLTLKNPWCSKALLIISLLVILQIPLYLVSDLTKERNERYIKVRNEIAQTWGQEQTVKMLLHAEKEKYTINITPEVRYRGIYQVPVYHADINIRAEYQNLSADSENGVYVSDINAVTNCQITVNGKPVETKIKENCYKFRLPAGNSQCNITLTMRGTQKLYSKSNASSCTLDMKGTWCSPGFTGDTLPVKRMISGKDFTAQWIGGENICAGVELCLPAGSYQQVTRCINYATFFLAVFFFTLVAAEIITKVSIHVYQYIVSAGAPVLFYLMTLAFSEKFGFTAGYIASAAVISGMITMYARLFIGRLLPALVIGGVYASSYMFNFIILRMEEWALFAGTIVLAIILGTTMVLTGKINRS